MANRAQGEAGVTLSDGRQVTLRYDFNALCVAEDAADRSISELLGELARGAPRLITARALIYAGLAHHHPEIGLGEVGDLIFTDGQALNEGMQRAMAAAFPQAAEGKKGGNPPAKRRGTGAASTRSGRGPASP